MILYFSKMHGAGNDFIILDQTRKVADISKNSARKICDRHFGIGADQILLLRRPKNKKADIAMHVLNSDGSNAETCGNGLRAVGLFCFLKKKSKSVTVETKGGISLVQKKGKLWQASLPSPKNSNECEIRALGHKFKMTYVNLGNPHVVLFVKKLNRKDFLEIGQALQTHRKFRRGVNFEMVERHGRNLNTLVWERGTGPTLACGSGACAVGFANFKKTGQKKSLISMPGGTLGVAYEDDEILLSGPAEFVFAGEAHI